MPIATSTCNTLANVSAFSFEGADVRVLNRSDEPWWVLTDVCNVLSIDNARNVAAKLDEDEKGVQIMDTLGGPQKTTIINESGLYSLILTSRKPAAKRFKKWVTAEVLPAIRKTGGYMTAAPEETIEQLTLRAMAMLKDTVDRQKAQLEAAMPKVAAFERLAVADGSVCLTDAAKQCQMKPKEFVQWLSSIHWIYKRVGSSAWVGYAEHTCNGDLEHKNTTVTRDDGSEKITTQVRVTAQGLAKLCRKLSLSARSRQELEAV